MKLYIYPDTSTMCCVFWVIVTGATCGAGNAHSFRNTWFHSFWGVHDFTPFGEFMTSPPLGSSWFHPLWGGHDFTHSLYIHYTICQSKDFVYGLMILVCLPGLVCFVVDLFLFLYPMYPSPTVSGYFDSYMRIDWLNWPDSLRYAYPLCKWA